MDQISEIILSDKEKTFYDFIFNYYAKNDSNMEKYITRESLTIIFKKSNLSKEQNITLWDKLMIKTKVPINTLYKGLKLISIAQNNPSDTSLQIEQPLPKIDEVPIQTLRADLEKASLYVLSAVITNTDYVKSGFLGINSYVVYTIESKSNLAGYTRQDKFTVKRRYKDFLYLNEKVVEKYKGCSLPKLPDKKYIKNTDLQFVEKRKEELQLFLEIICKNTIINTDDILRDFLTIENSDDYQKSKKASPSIIKQITSMKLTPSAISDDIFFVYHRVHNKMSTKQEPKELEIKINLKDVIKKIDSQIPLITKFETIFKKAYEHEQEKIKEQRAIELCFEKWEKEEPKENVVFITHSKILLESINSIETNASVKQLLDKSRVVLQHLKGLKTAINVRSNSIREYNTYYDFYTSKAKTTQTEEQLKEIKDLELTIKELSDSLTKTNKYLEDELQYFDTKLAQSFYNLVQSYSKYMHEKSIITISKFKDAERSMRSSAIPSMEAGESNVGTKSNVE